MEDARWLDPLLLTSDISWRKQSRSSSQYASSPSPSSKEASTMADHGNENRSVEVNDTPKICKSVSNNIFDTCPSSPEFSFSPDVVVCGGSPDIYTYGNEDLHDVLKNTHQKSMTFSDETPATTCLSSVWEGSEKNALLEASFELSPKQELGENSEILSPVVCINAGSTEQAVDSNGTGFLGDDCFAGGDIITTDVKIGDVECFPLYQTARFGNFSYHFPSLEPGNYLVDLHLSEIVFTDGPPGLRVFDVYIQEKKVVCGLDIFARVGANRPLLISNLKGFIDGNEGLSIKFEGVSGSPIVSGISVRKDYLAGFREDESVEFKAFPHVPDCDSLDVIKDCEVDGESEELRRDYECQKKELTEANQALKELRRDNELKNRECQEALNSLRELQNELMRKSMHVGSLAFAVEGQVKEKSKWFSSLRDLKRKLKNMKSDQAMLSAEALAYKNMVLQMDDMSSTIQSKMIQLVDQNKDLKFKFNEGAKERKELYNKVLEIKGNIRVFCRCRPLNTEEIAGGASMAIDFESAKDGELAVKSNGSVKKTFKFDSVFNPQADQVDVFKDTAPFATSVLDGYNVCIFAYGQTGTGKTFTMVGTDEARGVNFRTLVELFRIIKEREKIFRYDVSVSVLEVYNEQIRDLLVTGMQPGVAAKRLEIRQTGEGIHHVPGLVEANVNNMAEVWEVLKSGSNARAVGATNANEHSSRSHCIHSVIVKGENLLNGECTKSKLWLVDLAGSERVAKTEVQGERLKETQNINRSLSALGDVISALVTKSPHIPFRNSKLTHLLQDSLGGDSKTLMFVQISPNENDLSETLCSLNFASRVRGIELGPAKKQLDNGELLKYKQMFEKIKQENKSKDLQIKKMEETIHGLDMKVKERDLKNKSLQDKVKELETHLQMERTNAAATKPPLPNRVLGTQKNVIEPANTTIGKDTNFTLPLTENTNCCKMPALPATDCFVKYVDPKEKENNLEIGHHPPPLPKRTGRASICTTARRMVSDGPASRRNSLMPSPKYAPSSFPTSSPLPPLPTLRDDDDDDDEKENTDGPEALCLPEQTLNSPADLRSGTKKLNSILRRSIQKKMHSKSPAPHYLRGGINVGMEKVRVSIGSRGRLGHRVLLGSARRVVGGKEVVTGQQKQIERVKERGWNVGAAGKTVL